MSQPRTILFVCEHGAAKSIVAAAYFNKIASEIGLGIRALARGTHPDAELSPQAIAGLHSDGLTPTEAIPQTLLQADIDAAQHVISFCELPLEYKDLTKTERWDNVPPVSESYEKARDVILTCLYRLVQDIHL